MSWHLYFGRKSTGVSVVPDSDWLGMWWVRGKDGRLSDMANLARAKDAAPTLAPMAMGGHVHHWKRSPAPSGSPPVR